MDSGINFPWDMRRETMINIGIHKLTTDDFRRILFHDEKIGLDPEAIARVKANYQFLKVFARGKVIYGINTGLGPMAQYKINGNSEL